LDAPVNATSNYCYICLEQASESKDLADKLYNLCATPVDPSSGHKVHPKCLSKWINHRHDLRCPVCRLDIAMNIRELNKIDKSAFISLIDSVNRIAESDVNHSQQSTKQTSQRRVYINSDLAFNVGLY